MKNILVLITLVGVLLACQSNEKNSVSAGELTVYFIDKKEEDKAEWLAKYWHDSNLVTGKDQDIQLCKDEKGRYMVQLIASDPEQVDKMPFEEQLQLSKLRADLQHTGFVGEPVVLAICDNTFNPIIVIE